MRTKQKIIPKKFLTEGVREFLKIKKLIDEFDDEMESWNEDLEIGRRGLYALKLELHFLNLEKVKNKKLKEEISLMEEEIQEIEKFFNVTVDKMILYSAVSITSQNLLNENIKEAEMTYDSIDLKPLTDPVWTNKDKEDNFSKQEVIEIEEFLKEFLDDMINDKKEWKESFNTTRIKDILEEDEERRKKMSR